MKIQKIFSNKWFKSFLFLGLGAIAGFAYYYFIGCTTNSCPITSNPYISTAYGMLIGFVLSFDSLKTKNKQNDEGKA